MKAQASLNLAHNTKLIKKRKEKLRESGYFRLHQPNTKLVGLRQRIDSNQWSKDVFQAVSFPKPGYVKDEHDREHPTKLVKPVPADSSRLNVEAEDSLKPFAIQLKNMLMDEPSGLFSTIKLTQAGKDMKQAPNFTQTLKNRKLNFKQFVQRFPDILRIQGSMIFPA